MGFDVESARQEAERCVRRGDLRDAVVLYERIVAQAPTDVRARARLASVRALLQPSELNAIRDAPLPLPPVGATAEEEGERLAALGRFGEASAMYAQAVEQRPDSPLLVERYKELLALARELKPPPPRPPDRLSALRSLLDRLQRNRR